jgi:predicted site-specific integrase-resolvase
VKQYLTGPQVAARLGLAPATLRAWRHQGKGPPYMQLAGKGTQAVYDPDAVDWFIKEVWPKMKRRGGGDG